MPISSEFLKNTSVVVITGGSSGIGYSIIKAIIKLESSITLCNLSRTKPDDFFDKKCCIHLKTDLSDPNALSESAERLKTILSQAHSGEVLLFVLNWTLALSEDLRGTKVRTLAVCPGPTRSNFFKAAGFKRPPMNQGAGVALDMSADAVADQTLRALAKGKLLLITGWKNKLITLLGSKLPIVLVTRIAGALLRKMRLEVHKQSG